MIWKILAIALVWFIFLSFWLASFFVYKPAQKKIRDKNWFAFLISSIMITFTAEYMMADHLLKSFDIPSPFNNLADVMGIILLLTGLFFATWARITLGRYWSGSVAIIGNQPIIRNGPYVMVRHPIYAGVIAMLWGSFLLEEIGFVLFTAIFGTILLLCKARLEESLLEKQKGSEYLDYKNEVKKMV